MLFATPEVLRPAIFVLALFARALIAAAFSHWTVIGVAVLMGANPDSVVSTTAIIVVLLAITTLGSVIAIRRSQPDGPERMRAGPRTVTQWRAWVFAEGGASEFSGLLLYVTGHLQAGSWAMGIGTAMVVFETTTIVSIAIDGIPDSEPSE